MCRQANVRSTRHTRPSPEQWSVQRRAITAFTPRRHSSRDGTCRGQSRDRRSHSESENGDLVAERQGQSTCGAAPPSGSTCPPTKRQTTPAICRNTRERAQSPGKRRRRTHAQKPGNSLQSAGFRRDGRTTEHRWCPRFESGSRHQDSPANTRLLPRSGPACEKAGKGRSRFPGSATEGQMPGWHGLARAQAYTMRFVCGRCRAGRIATQV